MTRRPHRRALPLLAAAVAAATLFGAAARGAPAACLRGVNLSGAEGGTVPGRAGFDYVYPTSDEVRRMASFGLTAIRLPVRWERLQPRLDGPLAADEAGRLDAVLDAAEAAGLSTVIDLHNYAYYGRDRLGTPALPASALADLWGRLAARYRGRGSAVFSLMNEPHDVPGPAWAAAATEAIAAIRAAGARNLVLVSGTAWDGAHSWTADLPTGNNGRDMLAVRDPLGHGSEGERVDADPKAWLGWTAWAAGPWWPQDYPFNLQPTAAGAPPQLALLARLAKRRPCRPIGAP